MPKYKRAFCYFCGNPATTTEHAPPRSIFKGFVCDSITAPSCSIHNNDKSGDDQVFVNAFIHSLVNYKDEFKENFHPDVEKSIQIFTKDLHFSKKRIKKVNVVDDQFNRRKLAEITYVKGRIKDWIIQNSAVLVWNALKYYDQNIDWKNSIFYSNSWIPSNKDQDVLAKRILEIDKREKELQKLEAEVNWKSGWIIKPKPYPTHIFQYYWYIEKPSNKLVIKHFFFDKFDFVVITQLPIDLIEKFENL